MNLLPPNATALERDLLPPMLAAIDTPVEFDRLWDAQQSLLAQQKEQLTTTAKIYRALGGCDSVAPR